MSIRIKNWSKLQHFKDRTPPWIKLYRDLLDDPDWHDLAGDDAKVLIGLWLIASEDESHNGELPSARKLAFRLRVSEVELDKSLTRLSHWLIRDDIAAIPERYRDGSPETETETETERETEIQKECRIPEETAPPSAKAEKPPRVKKLKTTELKPESLEAFQAAWETIPASVVRWDATVRREVEEAVAKGSRAEAERNFQAIVDAKIATPRTLYVALYAYITEGEGPKKGFVQHCATFYGPKKRTYLEWLDRARAIEAERYGVPA